MSVLVNDPCNDFTTAPWTLNGTPTVVAGGHTGNGFQFPSGSSNRIMYSIPAPDQTDTLTIGAWVKFGTLPANWSFMQFRSDAGATLHVNVSVVSSQLIFFQGSTGLTSSPLGSIVIDTWYYIEAQAKLHDTAGTATLRVNGVVVGFPAINVDTKNAGTKTVFDAVWFNSAGSINPWQVDDILIRNDSTFGIPIVPVPPPASGSGTDPWWPDSWKESPELPAFRLQRETYGPVSGGDYVRGSTVATLPRTALRYASTVPGWDDILTGRVTLYVRAKDYHTAQIVWGWPHHLMETWLEVALVRSAFGNPNTVNDGEVVFRALRSAFETTDRAGEPTLYLPPAVEDRELPSGRWYYYTLFFRTTPLDWLGGGGMMSDSVLIPLDTGHADHLYNGVPPYYQWVDDNMRVGTGPLRQYLRIFGFELDQTRSYVDNYQELYHFDFSPMPLLKQVGQNIGVPYEGAIGDIRYRALLAQIGKLYNIRGTAEALERVCEAVSKYECDVTAGQNLLPLPDDSDPYFSIGNWVSIHSDTWTASNLAGVPLTAPVGYQEVWLYLPSEGHPAMNNLPAIPTAVVTPPSGSRGVLRIVSAANPDKDTVPLYVGIGDGTQVTATADPVAPGTERSVIPLYAGVPVKPGVGYGFSFHLKTNQPLSTPLVLTPILQWIGKGGLPINALPSPALGNPTAVTLLDGWEKYELQGVAPAGAVYLVPTLYLDHRLANGASPYFSYYVDLGGILIYQYGSAGDAVALAPDRYLTLGDPNETIGAAKEGFPGFVIGSPLQPGQQSLP